MIKADDALGQLLQDYAVQRSAAVLSSGLTSDHFVDVKRLLLMHLGAYLISNALLERLGEAPISAVGGKELGGALLAMSLTMNGGMDSFVVRAQRKRHGLGERVVWSDNLYPASVSAAIIDDVATTGASLIDAIEAVRETGAEVVKAIVVVDRQQGARERLAALGVPLVALYVADGDGELTRTQHERL